MSEELTLEERFEKLENSLNSLATENDALKSANSTLRTIIDSHNLDQEGMDQKSKEFAESVKDFTSDVVRRGIALSDQERKNKPLNLTDKSDMFHWQFQLKVDNGEPLPVWHNLHTTADTVSGAFAALQKAHGRTGYRMDQVIFFNATAEGCTAEEKKAQIQQEERLKKTMATVGVTASESTSHAGMDSVSVE